MKKWSHIYLAKLLLSQSTIFLLILVSCTTSSENDQANSVDFEVAEATITQLHTAMSEGQITSSELVESYLARIDKYDRNGPKLNSIIRLNPNALEQAMALDKERVENGMRGPLHGIPILLKDNYNTVDMATSASSVALASFVPQSDAFQVTRLREAGAVILGKTNMHELAAGITTISSLGGQTKNPYDITRNPGGSSGGTGTAIAASFATIGWGSDTCGSIRIPASNNNLFGLRPTKGLASTQGIIPLSHTQDVGGPLARTATDLAIGLNAIVGYDPADPYTRSMEETDTMDFVEALDSEALQNSRIGVLDLLFGEDPADQEIGLLVRQTINEFETLGSEIVEVSIPNLSSMLQGSSVIGHEFKWDLIDYLEAEPTAPINSLEELVEQGLFHVALEGTFRRRMADEERDDPEYRESLEKQETLRNAVVGLMRRMELDALVYPTMRRPIARIGDRQAGSTCQLSASTGLPALSVPAGFTEDGLPFGIELLGLPFSDPHLLSLGYSFEQNTDYRRVPSYASAIGREHSLYIHIQTEFPTAEQVHTEFVFEEAAGTLKYLVSVPLETLGEIYAMALQLEENQGPGGIIHRLAGPHSQMVEGEILMDPNTIEKLRENRVFFTIFSSKYPKGQMRSRLAIP